MMRTLALVRPVGMNDEMAGDWLAVALVELRSLSDAEFLAGCAEARATCTHHGQIIPAIVKRARETSGPDMATSFLAGWNGGLEAYSRGYELTGPGSGAKRIGSITAKWDDQ